MNKTEGHGLVYNDSLIPQTERHVTNPWYALAVLLVVQTLNYADRYLMAGLAEPIKAEFNFSDSFLGLLLGPAFAIFYVTLSIPMARLADRTSRVALLMGGCFVWSLFTALSGLATSGWWLAAARVGVGVGEAAFVGTAFSILADCFSPQRRSLAFAIMGMGIYFGQFGGYVVGPAFAATADWRVGFIVMGILGIAVSIIGYLTFKDPPRRNVQRTEEDPGSLIRIFMMLWKRPAYRLMNLGAAFGTFSGYSFAMWAPGLLVRNFDVPLQKATTMFGTVFSVAAIVGMLSFGAIASQLSKRDLRWPLYMAAISLFVATCTIAGVAVAPSLDLVTLLAIPSGMLGGGWIIGVQASVQSIIPDNIRATASALFVLVTTVTGMVVGPFLVGVLSDALGGGSTGLTAALLVAVAAGLPAAVCIWHAAADLPRAQECSEE